MVASLSVKSVLLKSVMSPSTVNLTSRTDLYSPPGRRGGSDGFGDEVGGVESTALSEPFPIDCEKTIAKVATSPTTSTGTIIPPLLEPMLPRANPAVVLT